MKNIFSACIPRTPMLYTSCSEVSYGYRRTPAEESSYKGGRTMELTQEMIKGTIVPVMLKLLAERAMYGYELIKVVNERTNNALQWKEGTLYPWLHRLEADGLIRGEWDEAASGRQRKYYRITRK